MPLYWILLVIFLVAAAAFTLLLFTPVVAAVDTRSGQISARWSPLLAYASPLPGAPGKSRLTFAGIPVSLPRRKRKLAKRKMEKPADEHIAHRRRRQRKQARMMWNCLLDEDVRGALMRRFRRLPPDLWEAVEVSQWRSEVSVPDPALNGMLWGALAATGGGRRAQLECNFIGRNELRTEVRLYPHRVAKAFLRFILMLPYWAIYKQWRAS